mmetsp:Transcript_90761/g.181077  ORF Transcript_90761/g.181077 Transcript_90761/m.181077 type:complete len:95 (+) Transcript_90761:33-317(+)
MILSLANISAETTFAYFQARKIYCTAVLFVGRCRSDLTARPEFRVFEFEFPLGLNNEAMPPKAKGGPLCSSAFTNNNSKSQLKSSEDSYADTGQ